MSAGNGLMYVYSIDNGNLTNAPQNVFEFMAHEAVPCLIHSILLTFMPTVDSEGIAQDIRTAIRLRRLSVAGAGGSAITPTPLNEREVTPATSELKSFVTTPGTMGAVLSPAQWSVLFPFERVYTPSQRVPVKAGSGLALHIDHGLGTVLPVSLEIYVEEF
jgi:hypothetical protein